MSKNTLRQYTIRNIPEPVDRLLRRRAKATGKSFNQVALEALAAGAGQAIHKRNLAFLIGSLDEHEASRVEAEINRQHGIDPALWP